MILTDEQVKEIKRRNEVERPTFYGATLAQLTETAIALRAQLAESAAREVAAVDICARVMDAWNKASESTGTRESMRRVFTQRIVDDEILDAIAALDRPSAAAAELTALRELERHVPFINAVLAASAIQIENSDAKIKEHNAKAHAALDAFAAIAQSRSAKP